MQEFTGFPVGEFDCDLLIWDSKVGDGSQPCAFANEECTHQNS